MHYYRITFNYGGVLGLAYLNGSFKMKEEDIKRLAYSSLSDKYEGLLYNDIIRVEEINGGN